MYTLTAFLLSACWKSTCPFIKASTTPLPCNKCTLIGNQTSCMTTASGIILWSPWTPYNCTDNGIKIWFVPEPFFCRLVHKGVGKIAALKHDVCFQRLVFLIWFLMCVGAGCYIRVKIQDQDIDPTFFSSIELQAVCSWKGWTLILGLCMTPVFWRTVASGEMFCTLPPAYFILWEPIAIITPCREPQQRRTGQLQPTLCPICNIIEGAFGMMKVRWSLWVRFLFWTGIPKA